MGEKSFDPEMQKKNKTGGNACLNSVPAAVFNNSKGEGGSPSPLGCDYFPSGAFSAGTAACMLPDSLNFIGLTNSRILWKME